MFSEKIRVKSKKTEQEADVILITLSDSEEEVENFTNHENTSYCQENSSYLAAKMRSVNAEKARLKDAVDLITLSDSEEEDITCQEDTPQCLEKSICVTKCVPSPKVSCRDNGKASYIQTDYKDNKRIRQADVKNKKILLSKKMIVNAEDVKQKDDIVLITSSDRKEKVGVIRSQESTHFLEKSISVTESVLSPKVPSKDITKTQNVQTGPRDSTSTERTKIKNKKILLSKKMTVNAKKVTQKDDVVLITLSDSEEEVTVIGSRKRTPTFLSKKMKVNAEKVKQKNDVVLIASSKRDGKRTVIPSQKSTPHYVEKSTNVTECVLNPKVSSNGIGKTTSNVQTYCRDRRNIEWAKLKIKKIFLSKKMRVNAEKVKQKDGVALNTSRRQEEVRVIKRQVNTPHYLEKSTSVSGCVLNPKASSKFIRKASNVQTGYKRKKIIKRAKMENKKKFLSEKMRRKAEKVEKKDDVILITLSDSEEEPASDINATENSIYIVEDIPNPKKNISNPKKASASLESSVCIIEDVSPKVSGRGIGNAPNVQTDNKENRSITRSKMKNKKVRSKGTLPSSELLEGDEEICEVSSTTDELAPKRMKISHETKPTKEPPADFIPLFICEKPGSKSSPSATDQKVEPKEPQKDVLVVDEPTVAPARALRPIVIDGSNVAYEHGKTTRTFSSKGIQLAIEYFLNRGHTQVTAFIPKFRRHRKSPNFPTTDPEILDELEKNQRVVYTPSRRLNGKCISSYDDRFIVQLASTNGGIILSNDNYRDLVDEKDSFKEAIEKRLLMFCFVGDLFMVPDDPLGREGPSLKDFLSFEPEKTVAEKKAE